MVVEPPAPFSSVAATFALRHSDGSAARSSVAATLPPLRISPIVNTETAAS
jgi:hypothetical protein